MISGQTNNMKGFSMRKLFILIGICSFTTLLSAAPLQVVEVSSPNILCFFNTNCTMSGKDFITGFAIPQTQGSGRLISRTYVGQPGSPLAGYGAYIYCVEANGI